MHACYSRTAAGGVAGGDWTFHTQNEELMKTEPVYLSGQPQGAHVLETLFSKARSSLYLIAHRILGEASMADHAVIAVDGLRPKCEQDSTVKESVTGGCSGSLWMRRCLFSCGISVLMSQELKVKWI